MGNDDYDPTAEVEPTRQKHSGLGIASFILSVISIIGLVCSSAAIVIAFGDALVSPVVIKPEDPFTGSMTGVIGASIGMVLFVILAFVGAVLGIIGLLQKQRAKLFPILGTVFNSLLVGGVLLITLFVIVTG